MRKNRLLNKILAGALVPVVFAMLVIYSQTSGLINRLTLSYRNEMANSLNHIEHRLQIHLDNTRRLARLLAGNYGIPAAFDARLSDRLFNIGRPLVKSGLLDRVTFVSPEGIVLARSHDELRFNDSVFLPEKFNPARGQGAFSWLAKEKDGWYVKSAMAVFKYDVAFAGVVLAETHLSAGLLAEMARGLGLENIALLPVPAPAFPPEQQVQGRFISASKSLVLSGLIPIHEGVSVPCRLSITRDIQSQLKDIQALRQRLVQLTLMTTFLTVLLVGWGVWISLRPVQLIRRRLEAFHSEGISLKELIQELTPLKAVKGEVGVISGSLTNTLGRLDHITTNLEDLVSQRTLELKNKTALLQQEIRERIKAEQKYRLLVDNATEAIFILQKGRITFHNPKVSDILGLPPQKLKRRDLSAYIHGEDKGAVEVYERALLSGEDSLSPLNFRIRLPRGTLVWLQLNGVRTIWGGRPATLNFARDITQIKQAQETLIQSEKMLSVGGLAAGMAHEINNPLAGMIQNAQVITNRIALDLPGNTRAARQAGTTMEAIRTYADTRHIITALERIRQAGAQAAEIVTNMLSFARSEQTGKSPEDFSKILEDALLLAQNDYNLKKHYDVKAMAIEKIYTPEMGAVLCQYSKIQQVLFNIIKNAAEAMAEVPGPGGRGEPVLVLKTFEKDGMGWVSIQDNGPGMDAMVRKRIFEPFFTTKGVDRGTGLGLSISFFIMVEDHGGKIQVWSEPGRGTVFTLGLPLA